MALTLKEEVVGGGTLQGCLGFLAPPVYLQRVFNGTEDQFLWGQRGHHSGARHERFTLSRSVLQWGSNPLNPAHGAGHSLCATEDTETVAGVP